MKGVILAGGTGSRLFPLTRVTNKHLLPVGRYPMIYHPIACLVEAGIRDIMVVTGREHVGAIAGTLGSGRDMGIDLTYRVQDQAGGIAEALGLASGFVGNGKCVVILGDNIFGDSIAPQVREFASMAEGAWVLLKHVPDPQRYGVAEVRDGQIVSIEEKPKQPRSNLSVTGVYMYDSSVFSVIGTLQPSSRGELEITDVNGYYLSRGKLYYAILEGWWIDAGTFDSLVVANAMAQDTVLGMFEEPIDEGAIPHDGGR